MFKDIFQIVFGSIYWTGLVVKEHITSAKVVVVLTGENVLLDKYALMYLDDLIDRKRASEAIIVEQKGKTSIIEDAKIYHRHRAKYIKVSEKWINGIYRRYCLSRFCNNLFFTYTDKTKNNQLGRFIRETTINEKDVVCLAIYNLRCVPEKEVL